MKLGFTLIELLIVIAIIGILGLVGFGSYMNSLRSARDARRKADLQTVQKALELYYQDHNAYPVDSLPDPFCHENGCEIAEYLVTVPMDSGTNYPYESDGSYYKLYSCIENPNDRGPGVNQNPGYGYNCGVNTCAPCKYGISSTNTTP